MDIEVINAGSVVGFRPLTDTGRDWIAVNVEADDKQWLGDVLYVEVRIAASLAEGAESDGLVLGV